MLPMGQIQLERRAWEATDMIREGPPARTESREKGKKRIQKANYKISS